MAFVVMSFPGAHSLENSYGVLFYIRTWRWFDRHMDAIGSIGCGDLG